MRKVLIAGASGLVGAEVLKELQTIPSIEKIVVLVRKTLENTNPLVQQVQVDFDNLASSSDCFKDIDTVFCCLGTTIKIAKTKDAFRKVDYEYPMAIALLSVQQNVKNFLCITAMGADPSSSVFYSRVKGEVERDISKCQIPSISFFRPSLLIGERKESRPAEKAGILFAKALSFLFIGPLKNYKGITVQKVAKAMIERGKNPVPGVQFVLSGQMQ
jgi:uncharacterized protein YbjT (DUF2867 family)